MKNVTLLQSLKLKSAKKTLTNCASYAIVTYIITKGYFMTDKEPTTEQSEIYKKALEEILNASTVGEMVRIADTVLKENKQ